MREVSAATLPTVDLFLLLSIVQPRFPRQSIVFYSNIMRLIWVLMIFRGVIYITAETHILNNVAVSRLEGVRFNGYAMDMKFDEDGKSLLVLDNHALWRLDLITRNKTLIAGSNHYGYAEGVGKAAIFHSPRALMVSRNKVIVCDAANNCLREVDLTTHQTSHLAGTCQSRGFKDGPARQAQFNSPLGLLAHKSGVLVADHWNYALRLIAGSAVSTVVKGTKTWKPAFLTEMEGQVFLTTDAGLFNLDLDSKTAQLVAGTSEFSFGFSDGVLTTARFDYARGIVSPAPGLLLIADSHSHTIRLVDIQREKVSSICTGRRGDVDGGGDRCRLASPWSLQIVGDYVYVGQYGGEIRTIPLQSITGTRVTEKRIHLQVVYKLHCEELSAESLSTINKTLIEEYSKLAQECLECQLPRVFVNPDIRCHSGLLSIGWRTNIQLSLEAMDIPITTQAALTSQLLKIQEESLKLSGRYLDITVLSLDPPIVSPVKGSDGLYLIPVVVSTCPLPEMIYDRDNDSCYPPITG